ncbi:hypothetical protein VQ056_12180 [Paenibacillus sp. JTLBN-2024]
MKQLLLAEMDRVIHYKWNAVEKEHADQVNQWLAKARETGKVGQYFIYQEGTKPENLYSYIYRKGYADYEISFIYDPSDPGNRGQVHVTGMKEDLNNDNFVQIKTINDLDGTAEEFEVHSGGDLYATGIDTSKAVNHGRLSHCLELEQG